LRDCRIELKPSDGRMKLPADDGGEPFDFTLHSPDVATATDAAVDCVLPWQQSSTSFWLSFALQ